MRPVRPGCTADASSSVPITAPGFGSAAYGRPSTSAEPDVAGTRPVIIRIVVVFPAPLGPRNPVTVPGSRGNETASTTVRPPYCLVSPLTVIMGTSAVRPACPVAGKTLSRRARRPRRPQGQTSGRPSVGNRHPKVDRHRHDRPTRVVPRPTYAPRMGLRARIWPGLSTRGVVLEFAIAVLSTVAISAGGATGDRGPVSVAVFAVLTAVTFVLLLTLRRRAPFLPFLLSAVLSLLSPAINGALTPLSYAMGRYVGRWPQRYVAAVVGTVAVAQPWAGGEAGDQVSRWL